MYKISGIKENYKNSGKIGVRVQIDNSSKTFFVFLEDIYKKDWFDFFSKEDCAYLSVLFTSENQNTPEIISLFPRKTSVVTINILLLAIAYTSCLILSNMAGSKVIDIYNLTIPAVLLFFPLTYVCDDVITEVYGFHTSRKIIWTALIANIFVILGAYLVVILKPSDHWSGQEGFETVFLASPRIVLASVLGYFFGEFLNSMILAKLKIYMHGKYLWIRSVLSTSVGAIFDSVIFCSVSFLGILPFTVVFSMILTQYIIKISYALFALPFIYKLTQYLKKADNVDKYDYSTNFNPFSLR